MSNLYTLIAPRSERVIVTANQDLLDRRAIREEEADGLVFVLKSFVTVGDPAGDHEHMHPAHHRSVVIAASLSVLHYHCILLANGKWFYQKIDSENPLVTFQKEEFVSLRHCISRFCREVRLSQTFRYDLESCASISSRHVEGFAAWS